MKQLAGLHDIDHFNRDRLSIVTFFQPSKCNKKAFKMDKRKKIGWKNA